LYKGVDKEMKIRKMVIEDYEKVYQLWMSCTGMGLNNLDDSKEGIEKFLKRNPDTCFVAEDHEIIGVILAGNDGRRGYIYHTAVHNSEKGVFFKLFHRILLLFFSIFLKSAKSDYGRKYFLCAGIVLNLPSHRVKHLRK
jgi:hypothetical protein